MTVDEYRNALGTLTPQQFKQFREAWGGTKDTIEGCVQEYAYAPDPEKWDRIAVFRLKQVGCQGLLTEREKEIALAEESARASRASADAAERSAESAARSVRTDWFSVVAALLGTIVALVVGRGCQSEGGTAARRAGGLKAGPREVRT